jgi:hypothetical protein
MALGRNASGPTAAIALAVWRKARRLIGIIAASHELA